MILSVFPPDWQINVVAIQELAAGVTITIEGKASTDHCPDCGERSSRIHSRYTRHPRDLPWLGRSVQLLVQVRRFFCNNQSCTRRTFAETFPNLLPRRGRCTFRLSGQQVAVALAVGGELGAELLALLQMPTGADTLLRAIRQLPEPAVHTPIALGVDDWAMCKRRRYGTILVDLDEHKVLDLLPDSSGPTLLRWLQAHPGIEVISRDRSGTYGDAASQGAPTALQVADRWHILHNLWDAVANSLELHTPLLQEIVIPATSRNPAVTEQEIETQRQENGRRVQKKDERPLSKVEQERQARREKWEARFAQVKTLQAEGVTAAEIVRQTQLGRRTVRKYMRLASLPRKRSPKPAHWRVPNLHYDFMVTRLQETPPPSINELLVELRQRGYQHSRSLLYSWVVQLRHELGIATPAQTRQVVAQKQSRLTARVLATLILLAADKRTDEQQHLLDDACRKHPDIASLATLAMQFATALRQRAAEQLNNWLVAAQTSPHVFLKGFVSGVQRDFAAVEAAFTSPYNNGQVEGQINRLKCLKRQMYGRAKLDLLKRRFLYRPADVFVHGKCG